jgi:Leucine-rich repeat (LRR) protein
MEANFSSTIPNNTIRLQVRNFKVSETNADNWSRLASLTDLAIEDCQLTGIANGTWAKLKRLQHLDVTRNQDLELIQLGAFAGLENLKTLDLSSNGIRMIENESFAALSSLEHLSLRMNRLVNLESELFSGLSKLQYLNLAANNLTKLAPGIFNHLESLSRLILANNPLEQEQSSNMLATLALRKLQFLDLTWTNLTGIPRCFTPLVRDLRLGHNRITVIRREDLDSFPHLTFLVLDDNNISMVSRNTMMPYYRYKVASLIFIEH